jgi:NAD+ synthase (glutamine-hydrolysing)
LNSDFWLFFSLKKQKNMMEILLNDYGFIRLAVASPELKIANIDFNLQKHLELSTKALEEKAALILFPELSLTSYSCADLFTQKFLLQKSKNALQNLKEFTGKHPITIVAGAPLELDNKLINCAVFINSGAILGIVPKTFLPNYNEFYEKRWFSSAADLQSDSIELFGEEIPIGNDLIFQSSENSLLKIGIEICEDLWSVKPVSSDLALAGANVILNLSASNELLGKKEYRTNLVNSQSGRTNSVYAYASASAFESSTDLVFSGHCLISENGTLLAESERFNFSDTLLIQDCDYEKVSSERLKNSSFKNNLLENDYRVIEFAFTNTLDNLKRKYTQTPFVPQNKENLNKNCREIINLQSTALSRRLIHIGTQTAVIGLSGGLDSTLALLVIYDSFKKLKLDLSGIIAVTMPGFGTTNRTKSNAERLAELLGIKLMLIDIKTSTNAHFEDIGHNKNDTDLIFENAQARRRTHILMDLANKYKGIVVGTGDLSEIALGWNTFNADHISMYNVNASVPKTLVKTLIQWYSDTHFNIELKEVLHDIIDTPISPELLPANEKGEILQETEEIIGPYLLHDFFLYYAIRFNFSPRKVFVLAEKAFSNKYSSTQILDTMETFYKRFFRNQFKRSVFSDGVKIGTVSLSPRGDWRMPSDADFSQYTEEIIKIRSDFF